MSMSISVSDNCSFIDKLRSPRIFGLALFDWTLTFVVAYLVGRFLLRLEGAKQWILFIIFWIIFGILTHVVTKTPTMMNYYLGLSAKPVVKKC
jgi:undecaprenyl pyrophosphate phosphatase UppP